MATVSGFIGCKTLDLVATVDDIKSQKSILFANIAKRN